MNSASESVASAYDVAIDNRFAFRKGTYDVGISSPPYPRQPRPGCACCTSPGENGRFTMMVDCLIEPLVDQFGRLVKEFEGVAGPIPIKVDCATKNAFEDTKRSEREVRWLIATFLNQCESAPSAVLIGELLDPVAHFPESPHGSQYFDRSCPTVQHPGQR